MGGACLLSAALAACAAPVQEAGPPTSGYDGGFFLRSPDGSRELVIEGLFQTTIGLFDGGRDPSSDVGLKRMRPELAGRLENLRFRVEPRFREHEVELEEAWVGADVLGGDGRLMFGRMKVPFGLEEVRSRRHIDFPAFSLLNQLSPAEDHGVFLLGRAGQGRWEYGLAATNGTGASDTNASKDLAARLMAHPFVGQESSRLQHLQVGLAATLGEQREGSGDVTLDNEAGLPVVRFAPDSALDGTRVRLGLEGAWYHGPWFAQAELVDVRQDMRAGAGARDEVGFSGGYLTLSRVLTGEDKTFGGVTPDLPFDTLDESGRGAWILALRLSRLEIEDDLVARGLVAAGEATDRMRSTSLGLNWVPNRNAIVRHALIWSEYGDEVLLGSGRDDEELAFVVELQLHF